MVLGSIIYFTKLSPYKFPIREFIYQCKLISQGDFKNNTLAYVITFQYIICVGMITITNFKLVAQLNILQLLILVLINPVLFTIVFLKLHAITQWLYGSNKTKDKA